MGPRSAGAEPGPACYGRGGAEPTLTDAYVVLGLLDASGSLGGGSVSIRQELAAAAVSTLAARLGLEAGRAAGGIARVAEAQIAEALRLVSVERGRDPRHFALLAFGGAGPLHQGPLSRELECPVVIVPRYPGLLSALGLLAAPVSVDVVRTRLHEAGSVPDQEFMGTWRDLEVEAVAMLREQGVRPVQLLRSADCRYRGQAFELEVSVPEQISPERLCASMIEGFHAAHKDRYGYADDGEPVEIVNLRLRAEGPDRGLRLPPIGPGLGKASARRGSRTVDLDGRPRRCDVYDRPGLGEGEELRGPAIIRGADSTCLLLAGQIGRVDHWGNLIIEEA